MGTGCRSGSRKDNRPCWEHPLRSHYHAPAVPAAKQAKWKGLAEQRKAQRPKYQRSRVNIRRGKTDLKAGLPGGLQGVLQGLAEEIVGDGRP